MKIFRITASLFLLYTAGVGAYSQPKGVAPLFVDQTPLAIRVSFSMKEIKKSTSDTVYFPTMLHFRNEQGSWDSLQIGIRARGNFRRKHCNFPPLRIKIKKAQSKGTVFAGTKNLKLVVPCQAAKTYLDLILKEYLCYKLYEPVSPYAFSTRLVNITLQDIGGKSMKANEFIGFFIEDDDAVAKRLDAVAKDEEMLHPMHLQDTSALRLDLFQYMIANTDFSTTFLHNAKIIQTKANQKIPLPYDFDMAGLVNAPYATYDESLGIRSVRDRVYKGFCRDEQVTEFVRREFIALEPTIKKVIVDNGTLFSSKDLEGLQKYMEVFFEIIKDDTYYKSNITLKCRAR